MPEMLKKEREKWKGEKVTVTIPRWILHAVDDVAGDIEGSRSDVVTELLAHCFQEDDILDEVFPYEDDNTGSTDEGAEDSTPKDIVYDPKKAGKTQRVKGGLY